MKSEDVKISSQVINEKSPMNLCDLAIQLQGVLYTTIKNFFRRVIHRTDDNYYFQFFAGKEEKLFIAIEMKWNF